MTTLNHTSRMPRKQLSEQLDRFDRLLDCLAEGLNEAVADAAREGARAALREVLLEVMTNPELLQPLRQTLLGTAQPTAIPAPQPVVKKPSLWQRCRTSVKSLYSTAKAVLVAKVARVRSKLTSLVSKTKTAYQTACRPLELFRYTGSLQRTLLASLAVGLVLSGLSLLAPTWLSSVLTATCGFTTALAVQVGLALKKLVRVLN